jgi:hypothetical protein
MKKFKDLIFEQHELAKSYPSDIPDILDYSDMVQAKMTFDNSNTISVVGGGPSYGDGIGTFEVMDHEGEVYGYLSKHEVTEIMIKSQGVLWLGSIKKLKMT